MNKKKLSIIIGIIVFGILAVIIAAFVFNSTRAATTMHLVKTEGTVGLRDKDDREVKVVENQKLYSGYNVRTAEESYAWIDLDATKLVKMDTDSRINITSSGKKLEIQVDAGNLFFNVTKPLEADEEMNIRTSSMIMGIRGTCGWVESDGDSRLNVYLLKGNVECSVLSDEGDAVATEEIGEWQVAKMQKAGSIEVESFTDVPDFIKEEISDPDLEEKVEKKAKEKAEAEKAELEQATAEDAEDAEETDENAALAQQYCDEGRAALFGLNGAGVNLALARENFLSAEELGSEEARFYLGLMYDFYNYPEQNFSRAKEYYESCGDDGRALTALGILYADGHGTGVDREKARDLFRTAIEKGYNEGYYGLGYLEDRKEQNYEQARQDYEQALGAEENFFLSKTMNNLGYLYCSGCGVEKNYDRALELFEQANDLGNPFAMNNIGYMYENGFGVGRDYASALAWYEKAAGLGDAAAMGNLGALYYNGYGVEVNYTKAFEYFSRAAGLGDVASMCNVGILYYYGDGTAQDTAKAKEWFTKAADQGSENAKEWLREL